MPVSQSVSLKTADFPVRYRDYIITYNPHKPIANHDYEYRHVDYDGPEDCRCGCVATLQDAIDDIDMQYEDDDE